MKRFCCGVMLLALVATLVLAQEAVRVITCPKLPPREILDRLGLELAWRAKLKFANGRDGIYSLQLIPNKDGPELVVQTLAGAVYLIDADTGDLKWRVPLEGKVLTVVGANSRAVFVARSDRLFALDRKTGMHLLYFKEAGQPEAIMGYKLPGPPSAPLTADVGGLFVAMGQRLTAYVHPDFEEALEATKKERDKRADAAGLDEKPPIEVEKLKKELEKVKAEKEKERQKGEELKGSSLQPIELWSYYTTAPVIQQAPLTTYEKVSIVTSAGNFLALNRFEMTPISEFKTQGEVSAPMGQYGLTAYVGSDDYSLYALDVHSLRIVWRFFAQAPILSQPHVTDTDIFVTADKVGMYRLVRETGEAVWLNPRAERFLSSSPKFVYSLDAKGNVLILDALRGTTLAVWDAREWTAHTANQWTDRFYLAAQDGQVIAMRHRDLPAPVKTRTFFTLRKEEAKKDEEKKDDVEKKIEDKKEKDEKKEDKDDKKEDKKQEKKKVDKKADDKKEDKKDDKKEEKKDDKQDGQFDQTTARLGQDRPTARWDRRDAPVACAPCSPADRKLSPWRIS